MRMMMPRVRHREEKCLKACNLNPVFVVWGQRGKVFLSCHQVGKIPGNIS